jgi:plastocyanin
MALAAGGCSGSQPAAPGGPPPDATADAAPDAASDAGAPATSPPAGFVALPPCLQAEDYVAGPPAVVTAGLTYQPRCLRVARGTTVSIEASATHPLEPGAGGASDSPIPHESSPATVAFTRSGFFPYLCPEHSDVNMRGVIWVTDP